MNELANVEQVEVKPVDTAILPEPSVIDEAELNAMILTYFVDQGFQHNVKVRIERFGGRRGSRWVVTVWADRVRRIEIADWQLTAEKPLKMLIAERMGTA